MAFRVEQTATAKLDLDVILEWLLAREAGETGLRWFQELREAVASLAEFPHRCNLAPEDADFPFEVPQLLYGASRMCIGFCLPSTGPRDSSSRQARSSPAGSLMAA
jgi:hypothetical protein